MGKVPLACPFNRAKEMQKTKAVCPRAHSEWEVNLELRVPCSYILHFPKWTAFYIIAYLIFQYSGHLIQTVDSLEKSLMLENIEGRRRRGCQRMRWLDGISDAMDMNLGKFQELVRDRKAWSVAVHRLAKSQTPLGHWKTTRIYSTFVYFYSSN